MEGEKVFRVAQMHANSAISNRRFARTEVTSSTSENHTTEDGRMLPLEGSPMRDGGKSATAEFLIKLMTLFELRLPHRSRSVR